MNRIRTLEFGKVEQFVEIYGCWKKWDSFIYHLSQLQTIIQLFLDSTNLVTNLVCLLHWRPSCISLVAIVEGLALFPLSTLLQKESTCDRLQSVLGTGGSFANWMLQWIVKRFNLLSSNCQAYCRKKGVNIEKKISLKLPLVDTPFKKKPNNYVDCLEVNLCPQLCVGLPE